MIKSFCLVVRVCCIILFCAVHSSQATEISPYIGIGSDTFSFNIRNVNGNTDELKYAPNIPGVVRFGLNYDGYGAALTTRSSAKDLDNTKGSTAFTDFQFSYHNVVWGIDLFYQTYKGFFIENKTPVSSTPYYLFPDLSFKHTGFTARYAIDNDGFSISGLTNQSDEVSKTAGAYYVVTGIHQHELATPTNLLPTPDQGLNTNLDQLRNLKATSINLGLSAGKYWVFNSKYFIGGVLDLVGTLGSYKLQYSTPNDDNYITTSLSYGSKIGFGYNGENWRPGLSVSVDSTTLKTSRDTYFQPAAMTVMFYLRYAMK